MTKLEFLEKLSDDLKRRNVTDAADIIEEYEQHFVFKLADGYSEEEIAARLGNPKMIAEQYDAPTSDDKQGTKVASMIALWIADFMFGILCVLLYAWEIVMAALVISFGAAAAALFTGIRESFIVYIPEMPYHCAFILGIAFAALTVLTAMGSIYFFGFIRQMMRSFVRFHKNTAAKASGGTPLPAITVYPQFSAKKKRMLRRASVISVIVFAICFILGFIVCVISAGAFEFWHSWGWFNYVQ